MAASPRALLRLALSILAVASLGLLAWLLSDDGAPSPGPATPEAHEATGEGRSAQLPTPSGEEERDRETVEGTEAPTADADETPRPDDSLLRGRVVRRGDGQPIQGATVALQFRDADDFWNLDMEYGARIDTVGTAQTDADGRFALPARPARSHRVEVRAHGFAARIVPDCFAGTADEIVIELGRGAALSGTVRCEGEPVVDAPVRIAVAGESIELARVRTDPTGTFRLAALEPTTVFAQVHSPNHSETWERVQLEEGGDHRIEIELPPSRKVVGRVVDAATDRPIAGAELATNWTFKRFVTADREGRFEIPYVGRDETTELHVRADGYAEATRNSLPDESDEIVIALERGAAVTGRILGPDGAALPTAYVAVGAAFMTRPGMQHTDWIRAEVDGRGVFTATGLRSDQRYWLYARRSGFGSRVYALAGRLTLDQTLDVGTVTLRPAGGVRGRVVDESGKPLGRLRVSLAGRNDDVGAWLDGDAPSQGVSQFESRSQRSAADGTFRFTDVAAGTYGVSVRPRGAREPVRAEVEVVDGQIVRGLELVVSRGITISGTLRRADGRSVADVAGELYVQASGRGVSNVANDGRFELQGLEAGKTYDLTIYGAPEGLVAAPVRGVPAGTTDAEIVLSPASEIRGRVVDGAGQGKAAQVWITWDPPLGGGSPLFRCKADGSFTIPVPPEFVGTVHTMPVDAPHPSAKLEGIRAGATDLELVLR